MRIYGIYACVCVCKYMCIMYVAVVGAHLELVFLRESNHSLHIRNCNSELGLFPSCFHICDVCVHIGL